jgi:hypothetical protein
VRRTLGVGREIPKGFSENDHEAKIVRARGGVCTESYGQALYTVQPQTARPALACELSLSMPSPLDFKHHFESN